MQDVAGVGVRVEVDHHDVAVPVEVRDGGRGRPGDRVVAADDDGQDAATRDLGHAIEDGGLRELPHAVADDGIPVVDHLEVVEHLDAEIEVVRAGVVGVRAHRARAEAGARAVRGVVVPRGADDRDVGLPLIQLGGSVSSGRMPKVAGPM